MIFGCGGENGGEGLTGGRDLVTASERGRRSGIFSSGGGRREDGGDALGVCDLPAGGMKKGWVMWGRNLSSVFRSNMHDEEWKGKKPRKRYS